MHAKMHLHLKIIRGLFDYVAPYSQVDSSGDSRKLLEVVKLILYDHLTPGESCIFQHNDHRQTLEVICTMPSLNAKRISRCLVIAIMPDEPPNQWSSTVIEAF